MNRVATFGNYQTALMHLMQAQQRGQVAQEQFSSGKLGSSLSDFGRTSETITAMKSTQARIGGFLETSKAVSDRLTTQDLALERISSSATETRTAISNALAAGRAEGLMGDISSLFQSVQDGLNTKHQGKYLFSGGAIDTAPSQINGLGGLALMPDVMGAFRNDYFIQTSQVDENITLETGFLADDIGAELYEIFKDIEMFNQAEPIQGVLTDTQRDFLTAQLSRLDQAAKNVVSKQAANGATLSRTDSLIKTHVKRADSLEILLSGKTDVNMAKAVTELEMSQLAIQASAQVVSQLRQISLLDYL